jgi:hypothetical protein
MNRITSLLAVALCCVVIGMSSCSEKSYGCYDISENYQQQIENISTNTVVRCTEQTITASE